MSVNTIHVGLLGLGRLGASFGLALRRYGERKDARQRFECVGYDPRQRVAETAQARGAAARLARSAYDACTGADIVIVALPYAEVQAVYRDIGSALRADAVVLDASPLKLPSQAWAAKHFPAHVHMVGITPVVNARYLFSGLDEADSAAEDMFDGGALLICPDASAHKDAVELAAGLGQILGAAAHFIDPIEHDGLAAATEGVPALIGIAMFYMLQRSEGWSDARRMGNPALGQLTHHLHDSHPDDLRDLLLHNRENVVRYLNELIETLNDMRTLLSDADRDGLEAGIGSASAEFAAWMNARLSGRWDKNQPAESEIGRGSDGVMGSLLGGFLTRKLRGDDRK